MFFGSCVVDNNLQQKLRVKSALFGRFLHKLVLRQDIHFLQSYRPYKLAQLRYFSRIVKARKGRKTKVHLIANTDKLRAHVTLAGQNLLRAT